MILALGMVFCALCGTTYSVNFHGNINMAGIQGYLEFISNNTSAFVKLNGTCEQINISLHEFPVMFGNSPTPCDPDNIGDTIYQFMFMNSTKPETPVNVSGLFEAHPSLADLSIVVQTCNHTACGNIQKQGSKTRTWQAKFYDSVAGEVYFRQQDGDEFLTVLTNFVDVQQGDNMTSNVSLYLSVECPINESKAGLSLGMFRVGANAKPIKSRQSVMNVIALKYASFAYREHWICAEVKPLGLKSVDALFDMNGVKGIINFQQDSPFDSTNVLVNLTTLTGQEKYYHVHNFPVPQRRFSSENLCDPNHTGAHWNPFNKNISGATYPKAPGETHDMYEIADLSGKHGTLGEAYSFESAYTDFLLPLFGINSIVGRSVVIHKADNTRLSCGNIGYGGEVITAVAVFRETVAGRIVFRQLNSSEYSDLSIYLDVSYSNSTTTPTNDHNWHVHKFPISTEIDTDMEACLSTGVHFNPGKIDSSKNYSQKCQPLNPFLCEVGDFTGKHQTINLTNQPNTVIAKSFFTDTTAALAGIASILGKSVVIHGANRTLKRIACANVTLLRPSEGKIGPWFGSNQVHGEFNVSEDIDLDPTSVSVSFTNLSRMTSGYYVHVLPVKPNTPNASQFCVDALIKGHFNPFNINMTLSPAPGNGTVDKYEVGDLSGKHGTVMDKDTYQAQFMDANLPLSGPYSILGRSLVIDYANGSRRQCANIETQQAVDGEFVRAKMDFYKGVNGSIHMVQQVFPDGSYGDVTIEVDVESAAAQDSELEWYITSLYLLGHDPSCLEDEGAVTYNPHEVYVGPGYNTTCSRGDPLHCTVGDMMSKHGSITLDQRQLFTDGNLAMVGDFTVIGRGLAIKKGPKLVDCALITAVNAFTALLFPIVANFSRYDFRNTVALALSVPLWKVNILPEESKDIVLGVCQRVSFFVAGYYNQTILDSLKDREELHKFKYSPICVPGGSLAPSTVAAGAATEVPSHSAASQHPFAHWLLALGFLQCLLLKAISTL